MIGRWMVDGRCFDTPYVVMMHEILDCIASLIKRVLDYRCLICLQA